MQFSNSPYTHVKDIAFDDPQRMDGRKSFIVQYRRETFLLDRALARPGMLCA